MQVCPIKERGTDALWWGGGDHHRIPFPRRSLMVDVPGKGFSSEFRCCLFLDQRLEMSSFQSHVSDR